MCTQYVSRLLVPLTIFCLVPLSVAAEEPVAPLAAPSIVYKVHKATERLEMTVNTSRILTMDQKIPQAQVNNPEILDLTPLSPTQIQISAKATGVTQVNLWGEDKKVSTIDVIVFGDARELQLILQTTFPNAALKVVPVANSVMISGFVDKPEYVERIIRIAEKYYPGRDKNDIPINVINNMTIGGCQQVLLHVKIMEVSRTKLRRLGFDWSKITGSNVVTSSPSGSMTNTINTKLPTPETPPKPTAPFQPITVTGSGGSFAFGITNGTSAFLGVLDALREDGLAKVLAEPALTTISGHPASFRAGGSFYIIPSGQNGGAPITVEYGTQLKFVPIVLGNGRIHLEVRAIISDIDPSLPWEYQPALKDRVAETGAELQAGQTLAIAGLVQTRVEARNRGIPWLSEVPYLGAAFRSVKENRNEIELLILVTPELVEAMDADEVPKCGPGERTTSPSDWELYMKGHLEVPNCCPTGGSCNGVDNLPPEGMILGPAEQIPTPAPADASGRSGFPGVDAGAKRGGNPDVDAGAKSGGSYNRYASPKPNSSQEAVPVESRSGPPGLIGPVGYDVVE